MNVKKRERRQLVTSLGWAALGLLLLQLVGLPAWSQSRIVNQGVLELDTRYEMTLEPGIVHEWTFETEDLDYLELLVSEEPIFDWVDPDGRVAWTVYPTVGDDGRLYGGEYRDPPPPRGIVTPERGAWRLRVYVEYHLERQLGEYPIADEPEDYTIELTAWRPATTDEQVHQARRIGGRGAAYFEGQSGLPRDRAAAERDFRTALRVFQTALGAEHFYSRSSMLSLAQVFVAEERYPEAEAMLIRAVELAAQADALADPPAFQSMDSLANLYVLQGRLAEAEALLVPAIRYAQESDEFGLGRWAPDTLGLQNQLATLLVQQMRTAEAEELLAQVLPLDELPFDDPAEEFYQVANSWARETLENSTRGYTRLELTYQHGVARLLLDRLFAGMHLLASIYAGQERFAEAELLIDKAIYWTAMSRSPDSAGADLRFLQLRAMIELARNPEGGGAVAALEEQFDALARQYGPTDPRTLLALPSLAAAYLSAGRDEDAARSIDEALSHADRLGPTYRAWVLALRAALRSDAVVDDAIGDLEESLSIVEEQRPQVGGDESTRAEWFGDYGDWYDTLVALQIEQGRLDDALATIERSRARTLIDQLAAGQIDLRDSIPTNLRSDLEEREETALEAQAELQHEITLTRSRDDLQDGTRAAGVERLEVALQEADAEVAASYAAIKNASPLWRDLVTSGGRTVGVREIQRNLLSPGAVMLVYQIAEEQSWLLAVPQRGEVAAHELTVAEDAADFLGVEPGAITRNSLEAILNPGGVTAGEGQTRKLNVEEDAAEAEFDAGARAALFSTLVPASAREAILDASEVVLIPDGALHRLAFEALVVAVDPEVSYWLDSGPPIRYGASATVLYNLDRRPARSALAGRAVAATLSVANPVFDVETLAAGTGTEADRRIAEMLPDSGQLTRNSYERGGGALVELPGTRREADAIAAALGSEEVETLAAEGATEEAVRASIADRRYVHFGTHGIVDERRNAMFSALALTPPVGKATPDNDGYLQLREIYDLPLDDTELVVLSACETNVGSAINGEGVFALSRGFLAAGARRVVASQWAVNDESTAVLIGAFFKNVREQEVENGLADYAVALRDAKRTVRERPQWKDPYYWAPFIITGTR
jgi:CHAT domain-containing protein